MAKQKTQKATSNQPSKSAAIVEQVQKKPEAGNVEVAEALNAKYGWDITPGYVSTIKSQKGLSKGRSGTTKKAVTKKTVGQTANPVGRPKTARQSDVSLSQLLEAKR